jgi:hypothetical protein
MPVTKGRLTGARGVRALAHAGPLVGGAIGLALPHDVLVGGLAWLGFLLGSLAGWGALAARAVRVDDVDDVDAGLKLAWGAAAYVAVAGYLLAAGVLTAPVQLALLAGGAVAHVVLGLRAPGQARASATAGPEPSGPAAADRWPLALVGVLVAVIAVDVVMAIVKTRSNVHDDDLAYTAFVRRLLQVGDLDEPFSLRRISAYGGQTVLAATAAVRGTTDNLHLVDAGLFRLITFALVLGLARARAADRALTAALVLVLALLPDTSINTSSHWAGVALFVALYRTACLASTSGDVRAWTAVGVVAAAAASLRQNHLAVVGLFGVVLVICAPARWRWRAAAAALAGGLVALGPYLIATWRSCGTPLYPLVGGHANPAISLTAEAATWWRELALFTRVALEPTPIRSLLPLVIALFAVRDRRPGRPLTALAVASSLGLAATVHGLTVSDPSNLWRYAFGFVTAWVIVAVLELARAPRPEDERAVAAPGLARLVVLFALLAQLLIAGPSTVRSYATLRGDLAAATSGAGAARAPVAARYRRLQAAAPAGARLAVMLDQPDLLDYRRNRIVNVDTPAYVSAPPGMPSFAGAEALAAYLDGQGLRYLAFVRGDASHYSYRRRFWLLRTFFEVEIWRVMGAYMVDFIDSVDELARTRAILFEEEGLVMLDLGARSGAPAPAATHADEAPLTRDAYVRRLAEREGLLPAYGLLSRAAVQFEDGLSAIACVDAAGQQRIVELGVDCMTGVGTPVRWMKERAHLRVRGRGPHRLVIEGRVAVDEIFMRPELTVIVDGEARWSQTVDADGRFAPELELDGAGWRDVYLVLSTIGDPWRAASKLGLARLEAVTWAPSGN